MAELSGITASFLDADQWICRYQRNNKRSGLKNLRCFPMCSDESHRLRGFCGRPAFLDVTNPEQRDLRVWSTFVKLPCERGDQGMIEVGTVMEMDAISGMVRSKADPFRPWIGGEVDEETDFGASSRDTKVRFVFNKAKRGWHYSWVANKHTTLSEHALRAYVFEVVGPNRVRLLAYRDSPAFTIFCRRRQRHNLDRLPAQLKAQLELQDMIKREGHGQVPRSIRLDPNGPKVVESVKRPLDAVAAEKKPVASKAAAAAATKRRRVTPRRAAAANARKKAMLWSDDHLDQLLGADSRPLEVVIPQPRPLNNDLMFQKPDVPVTTMEQKQHLLFHVLRSLLRMEVKSKNPGEFDPSAIHIAESPIAKANDYLRDPLGSFLDPNGDQARSSNATDEAANVDDFEPFEIDFSVLADVDFANMDNNNNLAENVDQQQNGHGPADLKFADIIKDFAYYLIEEVQFTRTIENTLCALGEDPEPLQAKTATITVLLNMLGEFLKQFNISLDELYNLFKTQVWDKKEQQQGNDSDKPAASTALFGGASSSSADPSRTKMEVEESTSSSNSTTSSSGESTDDDEDHQPVPLCSPTSSVATDKVDEILKPEEKELAEKSLQASVAHYTSTISSSNRSPQNSPRGTSDLALNERAFMEKQQSFAAAVADAAAAAMSNVDFHQEVTGQNSMSYIPSGDPRNDFTGKWQRPIETLNVLENIREKIGVPWVLRKLLRFMEQDLELSHGCLEDGTLTLISQGNRKLLSSGYQCYILDGKEHPWCLPPPLPTEKPQANLTYHATLKNGTLRLILSYSPYKRILRETKKVESGERLDSVVRFQFRDDLQSPWQDRLTARCCANRITEDLGAYVDDQLLRDFNEAELAWLNTPCDNLALLG